MSCQPANDDEDRPSSCAGDTRRLAGGWARATSDRQSHPVIGLWSVALRQELRHALVAEDVRRVGHWTARYRLATVTWPTEPFDPFFNANTPDDIAPAERLAELDRG
jgi:molybdopterin-guanine dinucleotide biosynthesis protein A